MQLDIFDHSRDTALRNDLAEALRRLDLPAARAACTTLRAEFPGDGALAPADILIGHLAAQAPARIDVDTVLQRRHDLEARIAPAARALLGATDAGDWMAGRWRALAGLAQGIAWQPELAPAHPAALHLAAQAWRDVEQAVRTIPSWRRIPIPLAWMTQARWRLEGADAGWPLLAELLWLAPTRAAALIPPLGDARLQRLAQRFEAEFEPSSPPAWSWLPAWAVVEQPLLAEVLEPADGLPDAAPVQGFGLVTTLLRLERQGRQRDVIEHRKRLQGLSAPLFAAYMKTR